KETAERLVFGAGCAGTQIMEVDALTPDTPEELFSFDSIIKRASEKGIQFSGGDQIVLVGHEGRLSELVRLLTRKPFAPLKNLDAVCVEGSLASLLSGQAEVRWHIDKDGKEYQMFAGANPHGLKEVADSLTSITSQAEKAVSDRARLTGLLA